MQSEDTVEGSVKKLASFLAAVQSSDGHWSCDYGGPMFLMPGMLIALYVTETLHVIPEAFKVEMRRYLVTLQNEEGGWGLYAVLLARVALTDIFWQAY